MYRLLFSSICFMLVILTADAQDEKKEDNETGKRPSWSSGLPERQSSADLNTPAFKPEIDNEIELDMTEFGIKPEVDVKIDLPISEELSVNETDASSVEESDDAITAETEQPIEEAVNAEPVVSNKTIDAESTTNLTDEVITDVADNEVPSSAVEPIAPVVLSEEKTAADVTADTMQGEDSSLTEALGSQETSEQNNDITEQIDEPVSLTEDVASSIVQESTDEEPVPAEITSESTEYSWKIIQQTPVDYPIKAAIDSLEGWVEVEVTINPEGQVVSAVAKSYSRKGRVFGRPAVQSVNKWLFEPPKNYGYNDTLTRMYKIEFKL